MKVVHLTNTNFEEIVEKSTVPVLVDFYADWCGPCKMIAPILEDIAKELGKNAVICKVNVDSEVELAQRFSVSSIPTIVVFKDGDHNKSVGLKNKAALLEMLK